MPRLQRRSHSPPVVYKDLVIIGTGVPDRCSIAAIRRARCRRSTPGPEARLGVLHHSRSRRQTPGADTWDNESWRAGHANVWAPMALDEARGLLYLPTSHADQRLLGRPAAGHQPVRRIARLPRRAHRRRNGIFRRCITGCGTTTSRRRRTSSPSRVDGRTIDAVAQVSKQGFVYVFDRVTGKPVWPIEERPVDATTRRARRAAVVRRSRFPRKPPPLVPQGVSLDDANDLTPEIKALARSR